MKKTSNESSFTIRLNQMASIPVAHNREVISATLNPSSALVSRSRGIIVSAPNKALGSLNAASSEIASPALLPIALLYAVTA